MREYAQGPPPDVPFPGTPERWHRLTLASAESRDGLGVEFVRVVDLEDRDNELDYIKVIDTNSMSCQVPLETLEQVGEGDQEEGLRRLVNAVSEIDFDTPGSRHPLYVNYINPLLGH